MLAVVVLLGAADTKDSKESKDSQHYRTVWDYDPVKFNRKVQLLVDDGWRIQAGVAVSMDTTGTLFAQALIK